MYKLYPVRNSAWNKAVIIKIVISLKSQIVSMDALKNASVFVYFFYHISITSYTNT